MFQSFEECLKHENTNWIRKTSGIRIRMMKMKTGIGDHDEKAGQFHFYGQADKRKADELKYTSVFVLFTIKTQ